MKRDVLSTEIVHQNPWFRVSLNKLQLDDQPANDYYVVECRPYCLVIAEQDGNLLLVEQYRFPSDETTIEFPMGAAEIGEGLAESAAREFREETGHTAATLLPIGRISQANGHCRMDGHIFVAHGIRKDGEQQLDESEAGLRAFWMPALKWISAIADGKITDGKSLAAWALFTEWKKTQTSSTSGS